MNEQFFKLLEEIDSSKLNMVYSSSNGVTVLKSSEYDFRLDQIHELKQENIKLQERIDKAIEYITNESGCIDYSGEPYYYLDEDELNELLEILKGGNK